MPPDSPFVIAVASGKGGVGKTWLAITLAHALTRAGSRVLLFDADLGLANVDVQLGLTPKVDLSGVVADRLNVAAAVTIHPASGLRILAGRSGSPSLSTLAPAALDLLLARLRSETSAFEILIADLGAGIDRAVRRIAAWSDLLLVMATEEPTSLTDAYAALKLHAQDHPAGRAWIVVNQAASEPAGRKTYDALRRACVTFLNREPPLGGVLRADAKVRDAIRHQTPLLSRHPGSHAAHDVEALAAACGRRVDEATERHPGAAR